ncbi:MAG: ABC transporter permease [Bacteroidota bacterium]
MNFPYFISNRISKARGSLFSSSIYKMAIGSTAIGLATMILSFAILKGFQKTVKEKIYNFSAHLHVTKYTLNNSFEEEPISLNNELYTNHEAYDYVEHVQEYSHKAGLIKTKKEVLGIVFKGIGSSYNPSVFGESIIEGEFIDFNDSTYSKDVLLSKIIADKLQLGVGDRVTVHFFQNPPRVRRLNVKGIYETNLSEYYDDKFIVGDIDLIRRLNNWADTLAGGMEVFVKDIDKVDQAEDALEDMLNYDLFVEKVSDKYLQVFEWLNLISNQVNLILVIILFVICLNMVSITLILIIERTHMIGVVKALGGTNGLIRNIFNYSGLRLIGKGLLWGNGIGLGISALQYFFHIIPLDPKDYYMSHVPISWNWDIIIGLNVLTLIVIYVILILPTLVISRIDPIKSIRFD